MCRESVKPRNLIVLTDRLKYWQTNATSSNTVGEQRERGGPARPGCEADPIVKVCRPSFSAFDADIRARQRGDGSGCCETEEGMSVIILCI